MNIIKGIFNGIWVAVAFIIWLFMQIWWWLIGIGFLIFFFKIGWGIIKLIWHFIVGIFS
jgi:hypothetical protein